MLQSLRVRMRALFGRDEADAGIDEELAFHVDRVVERHLAAGLSLADARAAARREFGNPSALKEQMRDSWGLGWLERLAQDIRYALRGFVRAPAFTLTVTGTIAIALGLNTTVFTVFDAYMLRPLAVRDPEGLFQVMRQSPAGTAVEFSATDHPPLKDVPMIRE
jgi:putative ABC transport system permease protein